MQGVRGVQQERCIIMSAHHADAQVPALPPLRVLVPLVGVAANFATTAPSIASAGISGFAGFIDGGGVRSSRGDGGIVAGGDFGSGRGGGVGGGGGGVGGGGEARPQERLKGPAVDRAWERSHLHMNKNGWLVLRAFQRFPSLILLSPRSFPILTGR